MNPPTSDFMGVNFPSLEYSVDMLSEFQPQQPSDFFVPTTTAPLDFVGDLFQLPSVTPAEIPFSTDLAELATGQQALSSSSSGSPGKERKSSRERQSSGRWSTRDKGPVTETRKLEVNREAQRRFRQRQKVSVTCKVPTTIRSCRFFDDDKLLLDQARSRSIETQLAEATAQLRDLRNKQAQLEARNQLLEKVALLNKSAGSSTDHSLLWQVCRCIGWSGFCKNVVHACSITVHAALY